MRVGQLTAAFIAGAVALTVLAAKADEPAPGTDRAAAFDSNCSMCHQLRAAGLPGQFPRLAGRVGKIAATAAGRDYLEHVVLFGMAGQITVDGSPILGVMPSFASLSNDDLAAALNYVANLDDHGQLNWKGAVFSPADIAHVRAGAQLSPTQVLHMRTALLGANSE
jgi:mono/diheme cytochrome c family protein